MTSWTSSLDGTTRRDAPRRPGRRWVAGIVATLAIAAFAPGQASAQTTGTDGADDGGNYVTTTIPDRGLDVSGFSPACIRDAPFVNYAIVPTGFVPESQDATLVVKDRNGSTIVTLEVTSLTGSFIYPGASVDAQGNATDWPGWKRADDGSWDIDPSDSFLREGLIIDVTVNPTATTRVSYPAPTSGCAGPSSDSCVPGQNNDGTPDDDCTPCVPGQNDDGNASDDCTPCTPGQNNDGNASDDCTSCTPGQSNDGNASDDCTLPLTGGGPGTFLVVGGIALLAGLVFMLTARRRRSDDSANPSAA